jgi:hypothetical protein
MNPVVLILCSSPDSVRYMASTVPMGILDANSSSLVLSFFL